MNPDSVISGSFLWDEMPNKLTLLSKMPGLRQNILNKNFYFFLKESLQPYSLPSLMPVLFRTHKLAVEKQITHSDNNFKPSAKMIFGCTWLWLQNMCQCKKFHVLCN